MIKLSRKKVFLLGGYLVFYVFVMVTCIRTVGRIGSVFGRVDLGMGEVLSNFLASLLPGPF